MSWLSMGLYFVFGLGLLILVHEWGHFIMAKMNGIRVEKFSIGFGPRIFSFTRGETEYCFSLLFFLGGYVKMTGQDDFAEDGATLVTDDPRSFENKAIWRRLLVVLGGPVMNLVFPWILMPIVFMLGVSQPKYLSEPVLINGVQVDSPASKAGVLENDKVVQVAGKKIENWENFFWETAIREGQIVDITILRDGKTHALKLEVAKRENDKIPFVGIHPHLFLPAIIGKVHSGLPAELAGLKVGDKILKIDEREIKYWSELSEILKGYLDKKVKIIYEREGKVAEVLLTPIAKEMNDKKLVVLGIEPQIEEIVKKYSFVGAMQESYKANLDLIDKTVQVLKSLFSGKLSAKAISGPLNIAVGTVEAAKRGLGNFFFFLCLLSVNLGIVNLLPVPVLDGGHVMYLAYETITRRALSMKLKIIFQQIGMVLLLSLMLYVTYNDINRQWNLGQVFSKIKDWF